MTIPYYLEKRVAKLGSTHEFFLMDRLKEGARRGNALRNSLQTRQLVNERGKNEENKNLKSQEEGRKGMWEVMPKNKARGQVSQNIGGWTEQDNATF